MPKLTRAMTKKIIGYVVGYGSGVITYGIIRNNVSPDRIDRQIAAQVAAFALGGLVCEAAVNYSDRIIDDFFAAYDKATAKTT